MGLLTVDLDRGEAPKLGREVELLRFAEAAPADGQGEQPGLRMHVVGAVASEDLAFDGDREALPPAVGGASPGGPGGCSPGRPPLPTARGLPRAAAGSRPSWTVRLPGLMSGVSVLTARAYEVVRRPHPCAPGVTAGEPGDATSINNRGEIVGSMLFFFEDGLDSTGFVYRHGTMINLNDVVPPSPGLRIVGAGEINDRGEILASAFVSGALHLLLLLPNSLRQGGL